MQSRSHGADIARISPFLIYVLCLFALPTILVISSAFRTSTGELTFDNFDIFLRPGVLTAFWNSLWLSAVSAFLGVAGGALACYALTGVREGGRVHRIVESASSTLSQFGGVMLAFAFIATLGNQGLLTVLLRDYAHIDIYSQSMWLYTPIGLLLPYLFFQCPLMIVTFYPAIMRIPGNLSQAVAMLGGSAHHYWRYIAFPMLIPPLLSSFLLLFANAFAAYATAAALISQGSQIAPLQIRSALISETGLNSEGSAGALAVGMLAVMSIIVVCYAHVERRSQTWLS